MKILRSILRLWFLGLLLFPATFWAQAEKKPADVPPAPTPRVETPPASPTPPPAIQNDAGDLSPVNGFRQREGRVLLPQGPDATPLTTINERARLGERPSLTPEVKERLRIFEKLREDYLQKREDLLKRYRGATDKDREKIREQLKDLLERWRERSRSIQEDMAERQKELLDKLPSHREVLENARERAREVIRDKQQDRRGLDR